MFDDVDEIVVAHPTRVAVADQVRAAEPRHEHGAVVLRSFVPPDRVLVVNVKAMREQFEADLAQMRFYP